MSPIASILGMSGPVNYLTAGQSSLYDFTSAYFTVSRSLTNSSSSDTHRYGPTQSQVRSWLSGTSNGGSGHSWANTYVTVPSTQGYQFWIVPKTGKYTFRAKGGAVGRTDHNHYSRGVIATADFNLTMGDTIIIVAGQGVPDFSGDHCNGGAGASWVARGNNISTAVPLLVGSGAGGDTSDGGTKVQPNTNITANSVNVGGITGTETTVVNPDGTSSGYGGAGSTPNSGGWLSSGSGSYAGQGFRQGLLGGTRSNSTAGYGAFGGGSGGHDESGNAGGGFTGASGIDNTNTTGHGSSFVNSENVGNVSASLQTSTTTFQSSDYTSESQFQGWVQVSFVG